jgi:hypothetical protein
MLCLMLEIAVILSETNFGGKENLRIIELIFPVNSLNLNY